MSVAPFYNKTLTGVTPSSIDLTAPGPIGSNTPSTGAFTTLTSTSSVISGGVYNGTVGATTPATGAFTTTSATIATTNNTVINQTKTTVAANNATITLTAASNGLVYLVETGGGNYTGCVINLPSTATLTAGETYTVNNNCATTSWTVQTSTAAFVVTSAPGAFLIFYVLSTASDVAASWDYHAKTPQGTTWSSAALATSAVINGAGGFNGVVGGFTPSNGTFTLLYNTNSLSSFTSPSFYVTNTNAAPGAGAVFLAPNMTNTNEMSLFTGQQAANILSTSLGYIHAATAATRKFYFGPYGGVTRLTLFGDATVAATLNCPITVTGLITGTDYSGTVGATAASTGKHTTLQLTTSMATAGVLLNDTSGNITSSLGALAVAKGGTGVIASYGTGTTVALPPTGGVAGQALLSGAGAGAAMTWSAGQGGSITRYQGTLQSLPTSLTAVLFQTAGTTIGQGALITYSAGTFTYTGAGPAAILVTGSVALLSATTLTLTISNSNATLIVPSNAINTNVLTGSISAVILLAQNETFSIKANQGSGGALNTVVGPGANGCNMSATILPI